MEAFVYRWRNSQTREWYIGYHKGTESDGYICSSQTARPRIQQETGWSRKILRRGTRQEMIDLERRLLVRLDARNNPRSLNRSNGMPAWDIQPILDAAARTLLQEILDSRKGDIWYRLVVDFLLSVRAKDEDSIKFYEDLFSYHYGPGWRKLFCHDITELKSK